MLLSSSVALATWISAVEYRSRADRRGAQTIGGISTAVYVNPPAASVGADRRGGPAAGGDVQIIGIGGAPACGHDAAGAVACGRNGRITDDYSSAAGGRAIIFLNFFIKKTSLAFDELIVREVP